MDPTTGPPSPTAPDKKTAETGREADLTGQRLGDFQILRHLGEGGMGQVYLAEQKSLNRKVALKLLRAKLAADKNALSRFEAEAKAVAQLTHANIVQVYTFGDVNGLHYMALEYVEGRNLRQYLEKKGPPELMVALSIMRQVAAALQRASELGIIHRDIKPENILLTRKGEVKVADFGLSRIFGDDRQPLNLTQSGVTVGTPLYMSPEQVQGKQIDPRTDIYSFGVTCYHLLSGQPPFRGQSPFDVALKHVQDEPVPLAEIRPDLPADLCNLVNKMMAKDPEERIQTGREIVRELGRLRDNLVGMAATGGSGVLLAGAVAGAGNSGQHGPVVQMGPVPTQQALDAVSTQVLSRPSAGVMPWLAVGSVLIALLASLAYGWWQAHDRSPQPPPQDALVEVPPVPVKEAAGPNKEEQWLLDAIKKYAKEEDPREALKYRIKLAIYYLKAWRLDDAEKAFKTLEEQEPNAKVKPYFRNVGFVGKAIVLAFRDQPKESNELFLKFVGNKPKFDKEPAGVYPLWQNNHDLSELVGRALDHNYSNSPATFPAALQKYRLPPAAKVKTPP